MKLPKHWPEYLMEMVELAIFMIVAAVFISLFEYPSSPVHRAIPDPLLRRVCVAVVMGSTAISIVYSPFGQRSGAHINPAVTLAFLRLGKISVQDSIFYILAQFIGAVLGVFLASCVLPVSHPSIHYLVTAPGAMGVAVAFLGEFTVSFLLMMLVLVCSNSVRFAKWTGVFVGVLVASCVILEAPLSGTSMNPARSFGPAMVAPDWAFLWIYFLAPIPAMLLAAELYVKADCKVHCAKLHHHNHCRCIFHCNFGEFIEAERNLAQRTGA